MTASVPRGHGPLRPEWLNGCAGVAEDKARAEPSPSSSGATGGVPPAELRTADPAHEGPRRGTERPGRHGAPAVSISGVLRKLGHPSSARLRALARLRVHSRPGP